MEYQLNSAYAACRYENGRQKVILLYGGQSVEHDVSLQTALAVLRGLNKEKYQVCPVYITKTGIWKPLKKLPQKLENVQQLQIEADSADTISQSIARFLDQCLQSVDKPIIFPALHGTNGEDGTLQGLLDLLQLPYIGNGVLSSALSIDKAMTKEVLARAYIPQAEHITIHQAAWLKNADAMLQELEQTIGFPCYVKPAKLGSSVGIRRCAGLPETVEAIKNAFFYDRKLVIEKEVVGREMQVAVLGNDAPSASLVGEYIKERAFMDYEAKYLDGKLIPVIPARLNKETEQLMREMAVRAFKALHAAGLMRVDFFVTEKNDVYLNEVNTLPGFTAHSLFPALWEKTDGTTYPELLERLIGLALERHEQQQKIQYTRCTYDSSIHSAN
nr:D-alanine--D-alanine ligase [Evansella caseinilytica]